MKKFGIMAPAGVGLFLAWIAVAQASIQMLSCTSADDGAINSVQTGWNYPDSDTCNVSIQGKQRWGPGNVAINFTTDTPDDPTIKSINAVYNDSGVAWIGYRVNVTLDASSLLTSNSYSISNLTVTNFENDWTAMLTQQLAYTGMKGSQYEYVASIDLVGGTPIAGDGGDDSELDYSYKLAFAGANSYTAIQEQTPLSIAGPILAPAPEPGTLILLLSGLLGLAAARVVRRRRA